MVESITHSNLTVKAINAVSSHFTHNYFHFHFTIKHYKECTKDFKNIIKVFTVTNHVHLPHVKLSFGSVSFTLENHPVGRRGGLIVSVLDSGSSGPGSSSGWGTGLCSWARNFTVTVPFSTQVYRRILCWW